MTARGCYELSTYSPEILGKIAKQVQSPQFSHLLRRPDIIKKHPEYNYNFSNKPVNKLFQNE
jgi:hypothetical protein